MTNPILHSFHIPVLGLGYTIDTPVKVGRFGISSVVSIIEDHMIERMREYYCNQFNELYIPIDAKEEDSRAKRITAYLNILDRILQSQMAKIKLEPFEHGQEIVKYFEMLPENSIVKNKYLEMLALPDGEIKTEKQQALRKMMMPGRIDVNIMVKVDSIPYDKDGQPMDATLSYASSALRGFANSTLNSSIIFSAGYNPRLYNYVESFADFYPDENGYVKKKIILKVSDFRSAMVQGKIFAKKGLWVSEFRVESGLNCGGHAFATDGMLLGPILEEFKIKRQELVVELFELYTQALNNKGKSVINIPETRITVQGGIGTLNEADFLSEYYGVDGTGWGSPFLLVPEATNVEPETLQQLVNAKPEDYYLSDASPLGVPFNNLRNTTSEQQIFTRAAKGRPGSPCPKKFLASDTEFTATPICTASRQYQHLKLKQLDEKGLDSLSYEKAYKGIIEKECLCEGLCSSVLLKDSIPIKNKLTAVAICPGPNLAYFSGVYTLKEMVDHIYGRLNLLNSVPRNNMFVNEAKLYIDYLLKAIDKSKFDLSPKQLKYFNTFKSNLLEGIDYYKNLIPAFKKESMQYLDEMSKQLNEYRNIISKIHIPVPVTA